MVVMAHYEPAITSNREKKLMHIKHKSVKNSSSRANLLDLFINIHCLSLCLCGTGGMLLMDDLFGEIAFGTSLNLLNNQSGKQLFEAKIHITMYFPGL